MDVISAQKCFGGTQSVFEHTAQATGTKMRFGVYTPPQGASGPLPAVIFLAGLTCTEQNFITKAGAQKRAAELGLVLIAPDTSPRGEGVADDDAYDLGQGAGFYLNATQAPWAPHFQMESYVADELFGLLADVAPVDPGRVGLMGHSMGGHGALTLHFKYPDRFKTVSAFAPIVAPASVPWGHKAFTAYLGGDRAEWQKHDACALVKAGPTLAPVLIDQGMDDQFLTEQLKPELFEHACQQAGQALTLRRQDGYDHSYYFIASFVDDHLDHHARGL